MSNRFEKFQDVFTSLLEAPDKETRDEKIKFEQMMTADFLGTLNNVKNAESREEGDALLAAAMSGEYNKFADELTNIKNADDEDAAPSVEELVNLMDYASTIAGNAFVANKLAGRHTRFSDELTGIKNASKRAEGNKDINALMDLLLDYASTLVTIKDAPTLEAGNEIIKDCMK